MLIVCQKIHAVLSYQGEAVSPMHANQKVQAQIIHTVQVCYVHHVPTIIPASRFASMCPSAATPVG